MSMNKYMHPRNPYRRQRVDFGQLAEQFDFFREACERDARGRATVNFKMPQQLSALTRALLLRDFNLRLQLPTDRLIPTVPLRLNYLLWLEDILGCVGGLSGIDIGTGSSCIYPLLGARRNNWKFVATDIDERNAGHAEANVAANDLGDSIRVLRAPPNSPPLAFPLQQLPGENFDFCMCNPPFFANALEAQGLTNARSSSRHPPMSASSAAGVESFSSGGETLFVTRLMQDSARHRGRCRLYTSMLGRKPSLAPLKRTLGGLGVASYGTYEFCQGRVMRWGIGWTFDSSLVFPMSEFKKKKLQSKPPLSLTLPPKRPAGGEDGGEYSLEAVLRWCKRLLKQQLRIDCWDQLLKAGQTGRRMRIVAKEVTWTRRRHKRRHPDADGAALNSSVAETDASASDGEKLGGEGESDRRLGNGGRREGEGDNHQGESENRQSKGESENRQSQGESENRQSKGEGESRQNKGEGESRQNKGEGESRQSKGESENRQSKGEGESCQSKGEGESRQSKGEGESRQIKGEGESRQNKGEGESCQNKGEGESCQSKGEGESRQSKGEGEGEPRRESSPLQQGDGEKAKRRVAFDPEASEPVEKRAKLDDSLTSNSDSAAQQQQQQPVLAANLWLLINNSGVIELRLQWQDGKGIELLHQLMLYIRNEYERIPA